jgi:hypothetical protein
MTDYPSSAQTRREVLRAMLFDGLQSAKIFVDQERLGLPEEHGFPASILSQYPDGVPLDLNPRWPLEVDLDGDPDAFLVSLSFDGKGHRCRIPWVAVRVIGVGFGGIAWEHDPAIEQPELTVSTPREARGSHLRVVK